MDVCKTAAGVVEIGEMNRPWSGNQQCLGQDVFDTISFLHILALSLFIMKCLVWIVPGLEDINLEKGTIFALEESIVFFHMTKKK